MSTANAYHVITLTVNSTFVYTKNVKLPTTKAFAYNLCISCWNFCNRNFYLQENVKLTTAFPLHVINSLVALLCNVKLLTAYAFNVIVPSIYIKMLNCQLQGISCN